MIDPNAYASKVDEVERLSKEVYLLRDAIDKSNAALAQAVRFKEACEKIAHMRLQDVPVAEALQEARKIAFDAFDSSEGKATK